MALDPSIPLKVNQVDAVSPLLALYNGRRQQKQDAEQSALNKQRQELSSAQLENVNLQNLDAKQQLMARSVTDVARNYVQFDDAVQADDLDTAKLYAGQMRQIMTTAEFPTKELDQLESFYGNPQQLKTMSGNLRKYMQSQLPATVFQDIENAGGQVVAQRNTQTNELHDAPDSMNQNANLDNYIQSLEVQNAELDNTRLQGQIAAQEQKAAQEQTESNQRQQQIVQEAQRAYDLTTKMLGNTDGLEGSTGPVSARLPSFKQDTLDFESDLKELENLLTLGNLGRMTGVLSESDIKILANAASGISAAGSETRMVEKLKEIQTRLSQNPDIAQRTPSNQSQSGQVQRGTIGRFQVEVIQ